MTAALAHIGVCRVCGCTDDEACWPEGCSWAGPNLCTTCPDLRPGQHVRIGKGKTTWTITSFGRWPNGEKYAVLASVAGYSTTAAALDRLTAV